MKTTTNQGWPVAQGTDPAKQYPAAVDDPFKTALDTKVTGIDTYLAKLGLSGVKIQSGVASLSPNASGLTNLNFPVAFASPPAVILTVEDTGPLMVVRLVPTTVAAIGTVVQLLAVGGGVVNTGTYKVHWIAIGTAA